MGHYIRTVQWRGTRALALLYRGMCSAGLLRRDALVPRTFRLFSTLSATIFPHSLASPDTRTSSSVAVGATHHTTQKRKSQKKISFKGQCTVVLCTAQFTFIEWGVVVFEIGVPRFGPRLFVLPKTGTFVYQVGKGEPRGASIARCPMQTSRCPILPILSQRGCVLTRRVKASA